MEDNKSRNEKIRIINTKYEASRITRKKRYDVESNDVSTFQAALWSYIKNSKNYDIHANYTTNLKMIFTSKISSRNKSLAKEILTNLLDLNLRGCGICVLPDFFGEIFPRIKWLNLERNNIILCPDSFRQMKTLRTLILDSNRIKSIEIICRLRQLDKLYLNNNRLVTLPDSISEMTDLRELELNSNQFEYLPGSIKGLWHLEKLFIAFNRLFRIEEGIIKLSRLRKLDLSGNLIRFFPRGFGELQLQVGKFSQNKIEYLPDDIFLPNLGSTLSELWLDNNNILELPKSFVSLKREALIIFNMNPLRSPPLQLWNEGVGAVMNYQLVRNERIDKIQKELRKEGLDISRSDLSPYARNVLNENSGYLTPTDMIELDEMFDHLINEDFFMYQGTVESSVRIVIDLYNQREHEIHESMLNFLLNALWQRKFSPNECMVQNRKWDKDKEEVSCFVVPFDAVFKREENNNNCSIFDYVREKMAVADNLFNFTTENLLEALSFKSPYGPVASVEMISYPTVQGTTEKLKSIVIVKTIYTSEQVDRRSEEEVLLKTNFLKMEESIDRWAKTRNGLRSIKAEVSHRKELLKRRRKTEKSSLKLLKESKLFSARSTLKIAHQRKNDFEEKKPFEFHFIESEDQARDLVNKANSDLKIINRDINKTEKVIKNLESELCAKAGKDIRDEALNDIKRKYCHKIYEKIYHYGRHSARKMNVERPWDSRDRREYTLDQEDVNSKSYYDHSDSELQKLINDIKIQIDAIEFNWIDMEDMSKFDNKPYEKFKDPKKCFGKKAKSQ